MSTSAGMKPSGLSIMVDTFSLSDASSVRA
jgi:hypothetical protein